MRLKRFNVEIVETDKEKISELISEGFEILEADESENIVTGTSEDDYESLSIKELKTIAKSRGLTISSALRKADIIEVLEAGSNDGDTETEAGRTGC